MNTCIIGAGSSGIVAAKILKERGLPFDCYELGSQIGGLWRYNNDNGRSAAYKSLHINSSRWEMAFSDFPMPDDYPDFPHHSHIIKYFDDYVDHFKLEENIQFRHRVKHVEKCNRGYNVQVQRPDGSVFTKQYNSVIVANGHHWDPKRAEFPGSFSGQTLHSHDYKTPEAFADKRVLIIGIGNSGCDIACDISRVAKQTVLSTRRGAHIIPKYIFGKPLDRVCPAAFWHILPTGLLKSFFATSLYLARGRMRRYGLPTPPHKILEEHPTVSANLLNCIGHGQVRIKPNVDSFDSQTVNFVDDSSAEFDAVVFATGYRIKFPFLPDSLMRSEANEIGLYRKVVHPANRGLYFIGLVQPWGPLMPLSEAQCEWVADLITGEGSLPSTELMNREIDRERQRMRKRYTNSERHTIQVDFHPYLRQLKKERKRSRRQGGTKHHVADLVIESRIPAEDRHKHALELLIDKGVCPAEGTDQSRPLPSAEIAASPISVVAKRGERKSRRMWGDIRIDSTPQPELLDKISALRSVEKIDLKRLFFELPAPDMSLIRGEFEAELMHQGQQWKQTTISAIVSTYGIWKGKAFEPASETQGVGYNCFLEDGKIVPRMKTKIQIEPSHIDGKPSLIVQYDRADSLVGNWIYDEIRQVCPGLLLGFGMIGPQLGRRDILRRKIPFLLFGPTDPLRMLQISAAESQWDSNASVNEEVRAA